MKKICHIGVSSFHRSHQAYCLYRLKKLFPTQGGWHIHGIGIRPEDESVHKQLKSTNFKYVLNEKDQHNHSTTVIDTIRSLDFLLEDPEKIREVAEDEHIKSITCTVTEKGYHMVNGVLDVTSQDVHTDIINPCFEKTPPKTVYGFLYNLLNTRMIRGLPGLPVVSCDNLSDNSKVLKHGLLEFIKKRKSSPSPLIIPWIHNHVTFPVTMVDRITLNRDEKLLCEPYLKWVIEDDFVNRMGQQLEFPAFHQLDEVLLTPDVYIHEKMKLLLLNSTHSLLAYLGDDQDKSVTDILSESVHREIVENYMLTVTMTAFTQEERDKYRILEYSRDVFHRFENHHLGDPVSRLRIDGGHKIQILFRLLFENMQSDVTLEQLSYCFLPIHSYFRYLDRSTRSTNDYVGQQLKLHYNGPTSRMKYLFGDDYPQSYHALY